MLFFNKKAKIDDQGYLNNFNYWNKEIAFFIAKKEKIKIKKDHWIIILFLRNFYLKFNIYPSMRILTTQISIKLGIKKSNSIYLFKLFPKSPIYQAGKIAGLPKTSKCL